MSVASVPVSGSARDAGLVRCTGCERLCPDDERASRCPRCGTALVARIQPRLALQKWNANGPDEMRPENHHKDTGEYIEIILILKEERPECRGGEAEEQKHRGQAQHKEQGG